MASEANPVQLSPVAASTRLTTGSTSVSGPPTVIEGDLPVEFGRYRILRQLGRGGMGAVYLAHDRQLDRHVALKVAHAGGEGSEGLQRFLREARHAAMLNHPNICPVYDSGDVGGRHYLTMAYIEGHSLAAVLKNRGPMTPRQAAETVRKIALGLQDAHNQGIIHRDLKPANIMIDKRGEPIVMDFGLARRNQDVRATVSGQMLGTPAYMPPEQVTGDVEGMGPGCDIYSLGVILYELLTGTLPFVGDLGSILRQILSRPPDRPAMKRGGIDPAIEAICLKAMAKQVDARFPTMETLAQALTEYLAGKSTMTLPVAPATVPPRKRKRAALLIGSALVGLAAVAAVVAAFWMQRDQGAVRIENDDPELTFLVDGVAIKDHAEPMNLAVGKHQLVVKRGEQEIEKRDFTVRPGRNKALKTAVAAVNEKQKTKTETKTKQEKDAKKARAAAFPKEGWTALFNGRDLSGWARTFEGSPSPFSVADASLVMKGRNIGDWIFTQKEYSNFELHLEFRIFELVRSGIALCASKKAGGVLRGMTIPLLDDRTDTRLRPTQKTGAVLGLVPPKKSPMKPFGEWNDLHITCVDTWIVAIMNGEHVIDLNLEDHKGAVAKDPNLANKKGHIGLESLSGRAEYRNLQVHEFPKKK